MKLTKVIIDENGLLNGFSVYGTEREFGGNMPSFIELNIPLAQLRNIGVNNNQVVINKSQIIERGNFKISELPAMCIIGGKLVPVNNTIEITKRYLSGDGKHILGFEVKLFNVTTKVVKYNDAAIMCRWLKPVNFILKIRNNLPVFMGRPGGVKMEELPVEYVGTKKAKASEAEVKPTKIDATGNNDILEFIELVDKYNGKLLMPSGTVYNSANISANASHNKEYSDGGFVAVKVGELANPKLEFNPVTLNVNATFKRAGYVSVKGVNVPCYVTSKKTMFRAGIKNFKSFNAVLPAKSVGAARGTSSVPFEIVAGDEGKAISNAFYAIGVVNEPVVRIETSASSISVMNDARVRSSILSEAKLVELLGTLFTSKIVAKALNTKTGILKEAIKELGRDRVAESQNRTVFDAYSSFSPEMLDEVRGAGIDIYSGVFFGGTSSDDKKDEGSDKTAEKSLAKTIEIEYNLIVNGTVLDVNKFRVNDIYKDLQNIDKFCGVPQYEHALTIIASAFDDHTPNQMLEAASGYVKKAQANIDNINAILWQHNMAMTIMGNTEKVHVHNSADWIDDETSKSKKYSVYMYKNGLGAGTVLRLKTLGVTI